MRFKGVAFRAHDPRWSWSPLSREGASRHGGRFNPKGMPALYLSLDWQTAVLEASQGFAFRIPPLTIATYDVDCSDIAELTTPRQIARRGISPADLTCPWRLLAESGKQVPTWEVCSDLMNEGTAGIIVRSFAVGARRNSKNLVLWRWSSKRPHKVLVFDRDGRLPRDDSSW